MLALNISTAVAWGSFRLIRNYDTYTTNTYPFADAEFAAQVSDGIMQTISFIILSYGIVKIRNFIIKYGLRNQINTRMICLQSVCFGSYLLANILLYVEIAYYSTKAKT